MNNLKSLRKEKGFPFKREMADFLKINEANYGKMENGKMSITKPMIEILEDKFSNYNLNWILYNEQPKYNTEKKEDNSVVEELEVIYNEKPNTPLNMNDDLKDEVIKLQKMVIEMQARELSKSDCKPDVKSKASAVS